MISMKRRVELSKMNLPHTRALFDMLTSDAVALTDFLDRVSVEIESSTFDLKVIPVLRAVVELYEHYPQHPKDAALAHWRLADFLDAVPLEKLDNKRKAFALFLQCKDECDDMLRFVAGFVETLGEGNQNAEIEAVFSSVIDAFRTRVVGKSELIRFINLLADERQDASLLRMAKGLDAGFMDDVLCRNRFLELYTAPKKAARKAAMSTAVR